MIGAQCQIGAEAIVHESILWDGAKVGAGAMVEQTVMAANAQVHRGMEARGSIVVETALSGAERQSLSGSMDFAPIDSAAAKGLWRRLWSCFRPAARQAV
jgi:NDP-sugar pyrophosphorylase family protein